MVTDEARPRLALTSSVKNTRDGTVADLNLEARLVDERIGHNNLPHLSLVTNGDVNCIVACVLIIVITKLKR